MPQVHVIEPVHNREPAKLRVCAYARVSSDSSDQLNSFASQVRYYTNLITGHSDWTLVDIYADKGITGTSTAKRVEFRRMMDDCRKGKIDRILVKSISRFARNTQDCIAALRELRQLGVTVVFEKEHINTSTIANEMLISMMSAFAQEESVSLSKNMRKGVQMRMKNGTYQASSAPYGYRLEKNGTLVVEPDEAEIVKRIFEEFICGKSTALIACELQKEVISKRYGNPVWTKKGIVYILSNEKYIGDELLQKSIATQAFPFRRRLNDGQAKQYYKEMSHEPIVSRETFHYAQDLLAQRRSLFGHAQKRHTSIFSKILICGYCGSLLYHRLSKKQKVWICAKHLQNADDCPLPPIPERELIESFHKLVYKLTIPTCSILNTYLTQLKRIQRCAAACPEEVTLLHQRITQLLEQSRTLSHLKARECIDSAFFIAQSNAIQQKLVAAKDQLARYRESDSVKEQIEQTVQLQTALASIEPFNDDNSTAYITKVVTAITVYTDHAVFHLANGLKLEELRP